MSNDILSYSSELIPIRDAIFKLMAKNGFEVNDMDFDVKSKTVIGYEDDQWSGTQHVFGLDRFDNLYHRVINDSPEQAGGWIILSFFVDGCKYCVNNIYDRYIYFPFKSKWFFAGLDSQFNTISISELFPNSNEPTAILYSGSCVYSNPIIQTTDGLENYCKTLLTDLV